MQVTQMNDFIRARSDAQKTARMDEIKTAADALAQTQPYPTITLSAIAAQLSWTRANLYKYVTSKEEIYLELCADKMNAYFDALAAAFPAGCGYTHAVLGEVWAGILAAHTDYLHYADMLGSIIESNVTVERLAAFKRNYYDRVGVVNARFGDLLGISAEEANSLFLAVLYHAIGYNGICYRSPRIREALALAGIMPAPVDFRAELCRFIGILTAQYEKG